MARPKRPGNNPLALAKLVVEIGTKQRENDSPGKRKPPARTR